MLILVLKSRLSGVGAGVLLTGTLVGATAASASAHISPHPVSVRILSPRPADNVGVSGAQWIVNIAIDFPGGPNGRRMSGFAPQLTGAGVHANAQPFPGTFGPPAGGTMVQDDRLPGLVVLDSTTTAFSGPGTNLANLFNTTGLTNRSARSTEILDNWIVAAAGFGQNVTSTLTVAVVKDLDHNGVFDDAPGVVEDENHDGRVNARDLEAIGLASAVRTVTFRINGEPA
jgi:hypothetical protein